MAPPTRPTKPAGAKKPGPKPKAAAAAPAADEAPAAAPARKRNMRPKMPVFFDDTEGNLSELGVYLGNTAEEALQTYLAALDDDDREQAFAAETYAVVTPDEGIVKLTIVPPTEPTIARR